MSSGSKKQIYFILILVLITIYGFYCYMNSQTLGSFSAAYNVGSKGLLVAITFSYFLFRRGVPSAGAANLVQGVSIGLMISRLAAAFSYLDGSGVSAVSTYNSDTLGQLRPIFVSSMYSIAFGIVGAVLINYYGTVYEEEEAQTPLGLDTSGVQTEINNIASKFKSMMVQVEDNLKIKKIDISPIDTAIKEAAKQIRSLPGEIRGSLDIQKIDISPISAEIKNLQRELSSLPTSLRTHIEQTFSQAIVVDMTPINTSIETLASKIQDASKTFSGLDDFDFGHTAARLQAFVTQVDTVTRQIEELQRTAVNASQEFDGLGSPVKQLQESVNGLHILLKDLENVLPI